MRADWTDFGECINGSIAHQKVATSRTFGGAATTNIPNLKEQRYESRYPF